MTTEPLTAAELARHLRLDSEDPGYADLSAVITAARQSAERFLNATIANRTRTLRLDAFPAADGVLYLPRGPVTAISSIAYVDAAGANQTVASYLLVSDADGLADRLGPAIRGVVAGSARPAGHRDYHLCGRNDGGFAAHARG